MKNREASAASLATANRITADELQDLPTPIRSWISEIESHEGADAAGDPGVFVVVVLPDRERDRGWAELLPIEQAIQRRVWSRDPRVWPYVSFRTASEHQRLKRSAVRG